jgi:hypothetical protein
LKSRVRSYEDFATTSCGSSRKFNCWSVANTKFGLMYKGAMK